MTRTRLKSISASSKARDWRFAYWFARISRNLAQHMLLHLRIAFGLNLAEFRILGMLAELDSISIKDIAAETALDKGQVTRAVADLTRRGLTVQVVDGRDRRLRIVKLTQAGQKLFEATLPFTTARQQRLEQRLTVEERRTLWKALAAISDEAERMLKNDAIVQRYRRRVEE